MHEVGTGQNGAATDWIEEKAPTTTLTEASKFARFLFLRQSFTTKIDLCYTLGRKIAEFIY